MLDDFERRRRVRETSNERVVCIVVAVSVMSLLLSQLAGDVLLAQDRVPAAQVLVVSWEVLAATGAALVAHLGLDP